MTESILNKINQDELSILMCDLESCDEKQKKLISKLMGDKNSTPKVWFEYISYVQNLNTGSKNKKAQLFTLLMKAISTIDQIKYKDDKYFLMLQKASVKAPTSSTSKSNSNLQNKENEKKLNSEESDKTIVFKSKEKKDNPTKENYKIPKEKDDLELIDQTIKLPVKKSRKSLAKSYIDDKIKNFDPSTFRDSKNKESLLNESVIEIKDKFSKSSSKKVDTDTTKIQIKQPNKPLAIEPNESKYAHDESESDEDNETIPLNALLKEGDLKSILEMRESTKILDETSNKFCDEKTEASFDGITVAISPKGKNNLTNYKTKSNIVKIPSPEEIKSSNAHIKRVSFGGDHGILAYKSNKAETLTSPTPRLSNGSTNSNSTTSESSIRSNQSSIVVSQSFLNASDEASRVVLNGKIYNKVGILGKGGSSCVHRVIASDGNLFAYKRVEIRGGDDADALCESYVNEIELLQKLKGSPHIIELLDAEVDRNQNYIAMVMEVGEIDLAKLLQKQMQIQKKNQDHSKFNEFSCLSPFFVRMVWQEMLEAVDYIHANRIVHGDLKPANFVFVKGHLKLIDFGIAKAFSNDTTNIYRDSQIGTINYMAPEAICPFENNFPNDKEDDFSDDGDTIPIPKTKGSDKSSDKGKMKMGKASDIWSMGCILYQMLYGHPPFSALSTIQKLQAIPNPNFQIPYPKHTDQHGIDAIKMCLQREITDRATIRGNKGLLNMPFLSLNHLMHNDDTPAKKIDSPKKETNESLSPSQIIKIIENVCSNVLNLELTPKKTKEINEKVKDMLSKKNIDIIHSNSASKSSQINPPSTVSLSLGPKPGIIKNPPQRVQENASTTLKNNSITKPQASIPLTLSEQIHSKVFGGPNGLKSIKTNSSNKWMKAKKSPEKHDMQAVLEKRLQQMRNFIRTDEEHESDESMEITKTGGDFVRKSK